MVRSYLTLGWYSSIYSIGTYSSMTLSYGTYSIIFLCTFSYSTLLYPINYIFQGSIWADFGEVYLPVTY